MQTGDYTTPARQRVIYGQPVAAALPAALAGLSRVALVTTASLNRPGGLADHVEAALGPACAGRFAAIRAHTPRGDVVALAQFLRDCGADGVVSIGGGSVCDAVKIARLLLANDVHEAADMDRLRAPAAVTGPRIPYSCIPTTLSAGEYTAYAGSTDERGPLKEAYHHPALAAETVILDPAMTLATPRELWFSTAIRAVDHAAEAYCAANTTPMAEATSLHALRLLFRALPRLAAAPEDPGARLEAQLGAWLSIQGFSAGVDLGGSHAIGHALGGTAGMSHGHTSCVMLPHVLRWNAAVNADRQQAIAEAAGAPGRPAADLVAELVARLGLPGRLRDAGVARGILPRVAAAALHDPWIATNPRPLGGEPGIRAMLEAAW